MSPYKSLLTANYLEIYQKKNEMKKTVILLLFLLSGIALHSQVTLEGTADFGKLEDMTYDPVVTNKIYALTQSNHLVVSTDNGLTWNMQYSFPYVGAKLTNLKIISAASLSFCVYNTQSSKDGIYFFNSSTNTITKHIGVPSPEDNSRIMSYDFNDGIGNKMILHTVYMEGGLIMRSKVFYTVDAGESWNIIYYSGDSNDIQVNNTAMSPTQSNELFIARAQGPNGSNGGLLISRDAALTWTESLPGYTFDAIAFNPANVNDILIGTSMGDGTATEGLFRSSNGGLSWSLIPISWTDFTYNHITKIAFHPTMPDNIIITEENEIVKSSNGGTSWTNTVYEYSSGTYFYGLNASYNPQNANQVVISTDQLPMFSNDGGNTLTMIRSHFNNVVGVAFAEDAIGKHLYYGASGARIYKNLQTGMTSIYDAESATSFNPKKNSFFPDSTHPERIFIFAPLGIFGGQLMLSTDHGATTAIITTAYSEDVQELTVDPNNANIIYVSFTSGDKSMLQKINFSNLQEVLVEDLPTPVLNGLDVGIVTGIIVNSADSNEIYIAKSATFLKSTDGGNTWIEKMNGLPLTEDLDIIQDVQKNPLNPNQFIMATNKGVYATSDSGENWNLILDATDTKRIKYSPDHNGVIIASVQPHIAMTNAIYYTADSGLNWSSVTAEDLDYIASSTIDYDFDETNITAYLSTEDLGVVSYTFSNIPLGIENPVATDNLVRIYPNPVTAILNIEVPGNTLNIENIEIYSLTGQKIMESKLKMIDVSALNPGIYLVSVTLENGARYPQKLIKK